MASPIYKVENLGFYESTVNGVYQSEIGVKIRSHTRQAHRPYSGLGRTLPYPSAMLRDEALS